MDWNVDDTVDAQRESVEPPPAVVLPLTAAAAAAAAAWPFLVVIGPRSAWAAAAVALLKTGPRHPSVCAQHLDTVCNQRCAWVGVISGEMHKRNENKPMSRCTSSSPSSCLLLVVVVVVVGLLQLLLLLHLPPSLYTITALVYTWNNKRKGKEGKQVRPSSSCGQHLLLISSPAERDAWRNAIKVHRGYPFSFLHCSDKKWNEMKKTIIQTKKIKNISTEFWKAKHPAPRCSFSLL